MIRKSQARTQVMIEGNYWIKERINNMKEKIAMLKVRIDTIKAEAVEIEGVEIEAREAKIKKVRIEEVEIEKIELIRINGNFNKSLLMRVYKYIIDIE